MKISEKGADNGEAYQKAGESLEKVRELVSKVLEQDVEMVELSSSLTRPKIE